MFERSAFRRGALLGAVCGRITMSLSDVIDGFKDVKDVVGVISAVISGVFSLFESFNKTRPKVHKERVGRLKSRMSVLEEQLRMVVTSACNSTHLEQSLSRLEEVLRDALHFARKLEDMNWIKRAYKKKSQDEKFKELNDRLIQESMSLVMSLNIDAKVMQETFNEERRRREDEADRDVDMKEIEKILVSVKDDTEEIKKIVEDTNKRVKKNDEKEKNAGGDHVLVLHPEKNTATPSDHVPAPLPSPSPAPGPYSPPPYTPQPQWPQPGTGGAQQGQIIPMVPMPPNNQVIICVGDLGDTSTMTTCRNCGQRVQTRVVYKTGVFAWMICGLCCVFGFVLGCCIIPFFLDSCKDSHHFCPECNVNLSIHKKM